MKSLCLFLLSFFVFGDINCKGKNQNVLLIAIDDLNDWIGCLKTNSQAKTPNIDRLASRGMLFTNAHCQAPICRPSRWSSKTSERAPALWQRLWPPSSPVSASDNSFMDRSVTGSGVGLPFSPDSPCTSWLPSDALSLPISRRSWSSVSFRP